MTKTFDLTANELKAALIFVRECLNNMGGKRPADLEHDEFTWIGPSDLTSKGYSKEEAAGTMSALEKKGVISLYDFKKREWVLETAAWRWLDTVWDANQ